MITGFVLSSGKQNFNPKKCQPLGVLYLLTILEKEFKDELGLQIIDLRGESLDSGSLNIPEKDVYFYSVTSTDFPDIQKVVKYLRKKYPRSKHIAGGPHVEIFKEKTLETFDSISFGEAEETIKRIARDLFNSKLEKVYNQQEKLALNLYPYPLRKFLPASVIAQKGVLNRKHENVLGTEVLFSRGCPFNCHFCANLTQGKTRFRSEENIIEEINYLKKEYGIGGLAIKDDQSIPTNQKIAKPVLTAIAKTGIKWRGQSRANDVHPDMVKLAKESGCIEIAVGVESVSQKVLEIINKKIDFKEAKEYLQLLKREDIDRKLLLIIGLPGESKDIADKTIDFIKETEPDNVLLSLFCPMPGSEMYNNTGRFGIKIDRKKEFDQYRTAFARFDENEMPEMIFEYEKNTPFGESMSNREIIDNYRKVQDFLRKNGLTF